MEQLQHCNEIKFKRVWKQFLPLPAHSIERIFMNGFLSIMCYCGWAVKVWFIPVVDKQMGEQTWNDSL